MHRSNPILRIWNSRCRKSVSNSVTCCRCPLMIEVVRKEKTVCLTITTAAAVGSRETLTAIKHILTVCLLSIREAACFKLWRLHVTLNAKENFSSVILHSSPIYTPNSHSCISYRDFFFFFSHVEISAANNFALHTRIFFVCWRKFRKRCAPS